MKDKRKGIISVISALVIIIILWFVIQQPFSEKTSKLTRNIVGQEHYIIKAPTRYLLKHQLESQADD